MGYFFSLSSLSKSATETAVNIAELIIIVSGLLLAFGAIGEYLEEHHRLPRWMEWPKLVFIVLVVTSLIGEFLGDAGVFVFSRQLQKIEGTEISDLDKKAKGALDKAVTALGNANDAEGKAGDASTAAHQAKDVADKAKSAASNALHSARGARSELASVNKDLDAAQKRVADIHEYLTPRALTQTEMDDLRDKLKPLADPSIPIVVIGAFLANGLGIQVWNSLKDAGFEKAELREASNLSYGMSMSAPLKYMNRAERIVDVLLHAKIGPMMGLAGRAPDTGPITIVIGDIRTAPLPSLPSKTPK